MQKTYLNQGHRQRLKEKFLSHPESFEDYELLELLLCYSVPRKDVKLTAKQLLKQFGSLCSLFNNVSVSPQPPRELTELGLSLHTFTLLKLVPRLYKHILHKEIQRKPVVKSWAHMLDYCYVHLAPLKSERLMVVYLNAKNYMIKEELLAEGSIASVNFDASLILRHCVEYGAAAIILAHNHPSGDYIPSKADITATKKIQKQAAALSIYLYDHLIVGQSGVYSFRENSLI